MSEFITGFFRNAAVPHEPMHAPIGNGLIASVHPLGTRFPPAGHNLSPSGSINRIVEIMPGEWASMLSHKACKISVSLAPPAIISRVCLWADRSDCAHFQLVTWAASFRRALIEHAGAPSDFARVGSSGLKDGSGGLMVC